MMVMISIKNLKILLKNNSLYLYIYKVNKKTYLLYIHFFIYDESIMFKFL
jgi:hypothetical protein